MPTITEWGFGVIVGFLVLQLGNFALPTLALGGFVNAVLSLVLLAAAVMLAWRVAHRGED